MEQSREERVMNWLDEMDQHEAEHLRRGTPADRYWAALNADVITEEEFEAAKEINTRMGSWFYTGD